MPQSCMIDAKFMPNQLKKHAVVYNDMHACSAGFARRSIERHAVPPENARRPLYRIHVQNELKMHLIL